MIAETKWTPGLWKAYKRETPVGFAEWEIHWSADGECVAEVVHKEADAHMMSTGPELYAALEPFVDFWKDFALMFGLDKETVYAIETKCGRRELSGEMFKNAAAAMTKARGEA